ncbi:cytochrome c peroxidase [Ramlibacter sp. AN1133]|uniref:cytochrome c peroxidase n=1 Tax=Ramlibacter sp. AN1133 TaxID=3133429 RepID=UPI0040408403
MSHVPTPRRQRLSANGQVACATCHLPNQLFQDGAALAKGVGTTRRVRGGIRQAARPLGPAGARRARTGRGSERGLGCTARRAPRCRQWRLREWERRQLVAFLGTLSGPLREDAKWLEEPAG